MNTKATALAAFSLSVLGLLLAFEVLRPFHDLRRDGPLALISWVLGAVVAASSFVVRPRQKALTIVALLTNLLPLCVTLAILLLLSRSSLVWH